MLTVTRGGSLAGGSERGLRSQPRIEDAGAPSLEAVPSRAAGFGLADPALVGGGGEELCAQAGGDWGRPEPAAGAGPAGAGTRSAGRAGAVPGTLPADGAPGGSDARSDVSYVMTRPPLPAGRRVASFVTTKPPSADSSA